MEKFIPKNNIQKKNIAITDEKVVAVSCKVDILDIVVNTLAAIMTGSVVMLAEVFQGISDLIVDGLTYIGMKRSKKLPNTKHPLGFGRELYLWSLFSTLIMFILLAGVSFYFGYNRFINPEPIKYIFLIYLILIIALISNFYSFSLSARRILQGQPFWQIKKAISQSTFLETKITFISDLMGILAALFGLTAIFLYQKTGNLWFDGLGAMAIALLMAFSAFWLFRNIKDYIIGMSATDEIKNKIRQSALEIEGVESVLDMKALVIGSNRLLVNLEVHIKNDLVTDDIEILIDKIKDNITRNIDMACHIQIEPETPDYELNNNKKFKK